MHGMKQELPATIEVPEAVLREVVWGDIHVAYESYRDPFDTTPLMVGLPDDRCQCPHWGYLLAGSMEVEYADHVEQVQAGELYYLAPGHLVRVSAGAEIVEFSPNEPYQQTMEVATRNFAAMMAEGTP